MDLLNAVLFAMSLCSFLNRYAQAVALCQDLDPNCSDYVRLCNTHVNVWQRCPLSCKQCGDKSRNSLTSSTQPLLSSSSQSLLSSSSLSISITSSHSIYPTQSKVVVLRSSIHGTYGGSNCHKKDTITTIRATASKRNLEHTKILMIIGTLWSYFLFP